MTTDETTAPDYPATCGDCPLFRASVCGYDGAGMYQGDPPESCPIDSDSAHHIARDTLDAIARWWFGIGR